MKKIILWGGGNSTCEFLHIISDINKVENSLEIAAIYDVAEPRHEILKGFNIIGSHEIGKFIEDNQGCFAVICAGTAGLREKMRKEVSEYNVELLTLVHPSAAIGPAVVISAGCVIAANVTISTAAFIGENTYISFNSSVGHHSRIGENGVICPGCRIGGDVMIGRNFFSGLGAIVVPQKKIADNVQISAGSLVASHIKDGMTVMAERSRAFKN